MKSGAVLALSLPFGPRRVEAGVVEALTIRPDAGVDEANDGSVASVGVRQKPAFGGGEAEEGRGS